MSSPDLTAEDASHGVEAPESVESSNVMDEALQYFSPQMFSALQSVEEIIRLNYLK